MPHHTEVDLSCLVFTALFQLIQRARKHGTALAAPTPSWVYGTAALHQRVALLLRTRFLRRAGDRLGITGLHSHYTAEFKPPSKWLLSCNDSLTRQAAQIGGARLRGMVREQLCRLQEDATRCGVLWGVEARLVVKGSCGTVAMFAPNEPSLGGFSRAAYETIASVTRDAFAHGDVDIDLLTNPFLSPTRFHHVRRDLCRCAAACVARLKVRLDMSTLAASIGERLRSKGYGPARRRSFVVQPAFHTLGENLSPPLGGLSCVSIMAEVGSYPGAADGDRDIRVPMGRAYVSSNELHFLNGANEVHFSLYRCMMGFLARGKRVHAEVLDISVPHLARSQLVAQWLQPTVQVPDPSFGTEAQVLAPSQQLLTIIETYRNASQPHKLHKRARRIMVVMVLLLVLRGRVRLGSKLRLRALCAGATVQDLMCLPARTISAALQGGVVREGWGELSIEADRRLKKGEVFWQPCADRCGLLVTQTDENPHSSQKSPDAQL
jgi:hypothetical protein